MSKHTESAAKREPVEGTSMPPWTLSSPDGRVWTGDSPLRAAAAAQRDTIDHVLAMQRINAAAAEEQALHDTEMAAEFERGRQLGMQQEHALWKEGQNDRKTLAEAAHKARRAACGEWSNIMAGLQAVLPEDFDARCDKAQAAEQLLADAIDRLASLPRPVQQDDRRALAKVVHNGGAINPWACVAPVAGGSCWTWCSTEEEADELADSWNRGAEFVRASLHQPAAAEPSEPRTLRDGRPMPTSDAGWLHLLDMERQEWYMRGKEHSDQAQASQAAEIAEFIQRQAETGR